MLLLDASASMRREDIWEELQAKAIEIVDQSSPTDLLSIYAFDESLRPLLSIDETAEASLASRKEKSRLAIKACLPGWMSTDLGLALTTAVDLLQADRGAATDAQLNPSEIVVVTDFQSGTNLEKLADYTWPESIQVRIERVAPKSSSNARATLMKNDQATKASSETSREEDSRRVFVSSEALNDVELLSQSKSVRGDSLDLVWLDSQGKPIETSKTAARVPPGSNLVVSICNPPENSTVLRLMGDDSGFDNDVFVVPIIPSEFSLVCIDSLKRKPEDSLAYFIKQIPLGSINRKVSIVEREPDSELPWPIPSETPLIVVSHLATIRDLDALHFYIEQGGHVLWVWDSPQKESQDGYAKGLERLVGSDSESFSGQVDEADSRQYSMLEQVDFRHPLFADLADSKFNDYSKIRFWSHRKLSLSDSKDWQILARFDDRSPALLSRKQGVGTLWLMLAGWQPSQSQFALSSKFVPLIAGMFRIASPRENNQDAMIVGQRVEWTASERVVDPSGQTLVASNSDWMKLAKDDTEEAVASNGESKPEQSGDTPVLRTLSAVLRQPGVYTRYDSDEKPNRFAVNLNAAESRTSPAGIDRLDQYGVLVQQKPAEALKSVASQHLKAVELESKQAWWQWLVMGVLAVVGLESWLCLGK
jgi:hypothetical protein